LKRKKEKPQKKLLQLSNDLRSVRKGGGGGLKPEELKCLFSVRREKRYQWPSLVGVGKGTGEGFRCMSHSAKGGRRQPASREKKSYSKRKRNATPSGGGEKGGYHSERPEYKKRLTPIAAMKEKRRKDVRENLRKGRGTRPLSSLSFKRLQLRP